MLKCRADVMQPRLDFEFRFFTGYRISIPAREMLGPERTIVLQLTVTPLGVEDAEPVRMQRAERAGPIPENLKNEIVEISGSFVVGEGRYSALWQMYDSMGAYCELHWELEAKRGRGERALNLTIAAGEVGESRLYLFRPQKIRPETSQPPPLDLKVYLNLDPWRRGRMQTRIRLFDFVPRLAALRALARHPRVGRIAIVAYSVEEQTVYWKHGLDDEIDLEPIKEAIEGLSPAFVSIDQLGKQKPRQFFAEAMSAEFPGEEKADAYLFLGPEAEVGRSLSRDELRVYGRPAEPVFMLHRQIAPWRGMIGNLVNDLGGKEYRFSTPKDLRESVDDLILRIPAPAQ